jgi:hypothetical protein
MRASSQDFDRSGKQKGMKMSEICAGSLRSPARNATKFARFRPIQQTERDENDGNLRWLAPLASKECDQVRKISTDPANRKG